MRYIKTFKVEGKIISKEELINLTSNIINTIDNPNKEKIEISAEFSNDIIISDNNISIFDNIYFEKMELKKIEINIASQDLNNRTYIMIKTGSFGYGYNRIIIETKNETLFNALHNIVQENLELMNKQKKIYMLANYSWTYLVGFILYLILLILVLFGVEQIFKIKIHESVTMLLLLVNPPLFSILSIKYIEKYYPSIQFKFGENSINNPKKSNGIFIKAISFILTNIVIPIIISWLLK